MAGSAAAQPTAPPDVRAAPWVAPVGPPLVVLRAFAAPPPATPWMPGHRGVDLAAAAGAPIRADSGGRVTFAGRVAGQGVVVVAHSAVLRSTFEPVRATVRAGDAVRAGWPLGRLEESAGTRGRGPSCPGRPCLHWGMLLEGRYVDPLVISNLPNAPATGAARLLPLQGSPWSASAAAPSPPAWASASAGAAGGGPPGPPGGGAVLAVDAAVTSLGVGAVAVAARVRRNRRVSGPGP